MTKISQALAYLQAHPGASRYEAAKHAQMPPANLYARLKLDKAKAKGVCPTCGKQR